MIHTHIQFVFYISDSYMPIYFENTCEEGGRTLTCDEGYVVKIVDVKCLPYNFTCAEKITRLCNGLRSCSKIDLRRQLNYHCNDYPTNKVITSFQCVPGMSGFLSFSSQFSL